MGRIFSQSQGKFIDVPDTQPSSGGGISADTDINSILQKAAILDLAKGGKNITKLSGIAGLFPGKSEEEKKQLKRNTDVSTAAKNYLDTYQSLLSKGDLESEDAKRQLAFAAGKYNSIAGFGEGGKTLTASELGILAPTLIKTQRQRDKNLFEKIFGTNPEMTKGLLEEDPATAAEKMKLALKNTNPELYSQYQSMIPSDQIEKTGRTTGGETLNPNLIENVGTNLKDMITGLPQFGKAIVDMTPVGQVIDMIQGEPIDPAKPYKTAINMAAGIVNNLGQTVGVVKDEQGNYTWDPKAAFIHDYNHPVDTALWILPFFKVLKGSKGMLAEKGAVVKTGTKAGIIDQAVVDFSKTSKAGEAARGIAVPVPESLIKSEEIMSKALRYTSEKTNSYAAAAKELESSIPKQSLIIEKWAKNTDATIGPQPLDQIVSQVMEKVSNTTVARANPNLLKTVEETLRKQLSTGQLEGGMSRGEIEAATMESINNTRKYFTSGKDSWFNNGQPVGTLTNDLNALEWQTANTLKDIMAEADSAGVVREALDRQHVAYETYPVLSKMAMEKTGFGANSLKWGILRKLWEESGAKAVEEAKFKRSRKLQGGTLEQILSKAPEGQVLSQPVMQSAPLPQAPTAQKQPLPSGIVENMLTKKGPAQTYRLAQDYLLKQSSKRRYK